MKIRKQIYLTDTEYFCNRSFTLSYSMITKSWISFHSYLPNFYVAENNFFYSGMNGCCDDFDFIVGIPLAESGCIFDGTAYILIPPEPDSNFTAQIEILPNCELEGNAYSIVDCTLEGTAIETEIPCVRPEDVQRYNFVTGYNDVDSTISKEDACDVAAYLLTLEEGYTEVIHWIAVELTGFVVGNTVYANHGDTSCECIPDGWYFTNESAFLHIVYHVENCVITAIIDCNATTTTTTTLFPPHCALEGWAQILEFPETCDYNSGTAYVDSVIDNTMLVTVTLNEGIGEDLGPDFLITCDVEGWFTIATEEELYAGVQITVPEEAVFIYIQSLGVCLNILSIPIETLYCELAGNAIEIATTTTTSTSTSTSTSTTTTTSSTTTTTTTTTQQETTTTTTTEEPEPTTTTTTTIDPYDCSYIQVELIYPTDPCEPATTTTTTTQFVEPPCNINYSFEIENCEETTTSTTTTTTTIYVADYGALYNYAAVTSVKGLANSSETNWRVPTNTDWDNLINYLSPEEGSKLKQVGTTYWTTPNTGATNSAGFNGRGGGQRSTTGTFANLNNIGFFYSSTLFDVDEAYNYVLRYDTEYMDEMPIVTHLDTGMSVRLVNPSTALTNGQTGTYTGNDGKTYRTICIGTQEWLADSLAETKYDNGDWIPGYDGGVYTPIADATWGSLTTDAMCAYNNDWNNV